MTFRGTNDYPADWRDLATRVKREAGWRCVRCGHLDDPGQCAAAGVQRGYLACDDLCEHEPDGRRRVLTVHHLDGDKANGAWWNVPALCQVCHLEVQAKVRMAQTYMGEHSEWFKPYVAGYYAATILGEDLTRTEVADRLDELLAAGQPWNAEGAEGQGDLFPETAERRQGSALEGGR